jgi:hypothetical protein
VHLLFPYLFLAILRSVGPKAYALRIAPSCHKLDTCLPKTRKALSCALAGMSRADSPVAGAPGFEMSALESPASSSMAAMTPSHLLTATPSSTHDTSAAVTGAAGTGASISVAGNTGPGITGPGLARLGRPAGFDSLTRTVKRRYTRMLGGSSEVTWRSSAGPR